LFKSIYWTKTQDDKPQCKYMNKQGYNFVVRMESKYNWVAIALFLPSFMSGQIITNGSSDINCFNKAVEEINEKSSVTPKI